MDNIIVHLISAVLAPALTGSKYFYRLFYRISGIDLMAASGLSKEVTL